MSQEIIEAKTTDAVVVHSNHDLLGSIKGALVARGIDSDFISEKILKLMNARGVTNSGIEFDDNKVILDTLKLVLKLGGIRGLGDGPQIAIFNNAPGKDEKLQF